MCDMYSWPAAAGLKLSLIITESGGKVTSSNRVSPGAGTYWLCSEIGSGRHAAPGVVPVDHSNADDIPGTLT